ncbi:ATP synthase subunit I [Paenibacillus macerans]|uniref:ATP synthase subunit I n=1 Tax=Paenibacillus macerans TaxID=44252 RepID=UPI00243149E4|nr:ATP synthase subunit I [Paenibacillus macerans]MBS5912432.1 ATP synthase subunit I [Paenibacillus macerans]MED4953368.1 ATP synthase subunit I [Paenibacillus macerans]
MDELSKLSRALTAGTLGFLALCFLGGALLPGLQSIMLGMALGAAVSWINAYYLGRKVRRLGDAAAAGEAKRINMGFLTRTATAVLAVFAAMKYPQHLNVYAVAGSLVFAQLYLLIIGIKYSRKP